MKFRRLSANDLTIGLVDQAVVDLVNARDRGVVQADPVAWAGRAPAARALLTRNIS
jgi:hypothetical protein